MEDSSELLKKIIELKPGGQVRDQQQIAVEKIDKALKEKLNLLLEAPTGSGKTLSYMIPLIKNGCKAVVSTATKSLSEQVILEDVPFLAKTIKEVAPAYEFKAALLKGRENYFCKAKEAEQSRFSEEADALFSTFDMDNTKQDSPTSAKGKKIASESKKLLKWADTTRSGDRSEAPAVNDETWAMYSSTTAECPGRAVCSFASECFAERARAKAKEADIVVTNHAVVANDLRLEEPLLLGDREVYVFDELHELDRYLTNTWGSTMASKGLKDNLKAFSTVSGVSEETLKEYESLCKKFKSLTELFEVGLIEGSHQTLEQYMSKLYKVATKIQTAGQEQANEKDSSEAKKKLGSTVAKRAGGIADNALMLMNDSDEIVRWVSETKDFKSKEEPVRTLHAAPLRVGPTLQNALAGRDAIMIGTSATIRVGGDFEIPVHNLDLKQADAEFETHALTSPFNYPKQAMTYIPAADSFPAPTWETRQEHAAAVREHAAAFIKAMGGRALMLHTTRFEVEQMGTHLKKELKGTGINVLVQYEAPNQQLVDDFKSDETSVLVATMGMWHGLDVQGPSLSLVMMDKIPFTPMKEPLSLARQNWANNNGRNGFNDVYVADANVMLAQGAGRLVRSVSDKGIIAIFDTRLLTKGYGKTMMKTLPDTKVFTNRDIVLKAAERLRDSL